MPNMVELIKKAALDAVKESKPTSIVFGTVISIEPLKINVEQKLTLSSAQLILTNNVLDHKTQISFDDPNVKNIVKNYSMDDVPGTNYKLTYQEPVKNVITIYNGLKNGDEVLMIQMQGGQKFIVFDKVVKA